MILTRDNILRFVREKKAVTPTMIAESFDTTTMIASAALSEIAKDKLIGITKLKLASSPYYYDMKQKEYLMELGEKHLSKHEKDIFLKLKEKEILSDNSLTIQEKLAIENIKDFAIPMTLTSDENDMTFWIWYMRNLDETRKQINDALNPKKTNKPTQKKASKSAPKKSQTVKQAIKKEIQKPKVTLKSVNKAPTKTINQYNEPTYNQQQGYSNQNNYNQQNQYNQQQYNSHQYEQNYQNHNQNNFNQSRQSHQHQQSFQEEKTSNKKFKPSTNNDESQIENFIENFFNENYLKIENKIKEEKGIQYQTSLQLNTMEIQIDCFYFYKKTNESELIKFYTSSLKPKIVFVVNCPKKLLKLSENIENLTIVNI